MMKWFKYIFILGFICLGTKTWASQTIYVKIAGLTCSQCTRSVEMQLKKLKFIATIEMDLQQTQAILNVRSDQKVDYNAIAKAVKNSGFTMANMQTKIAVNESGKISNHCYQTKDGYFYFIEPTTITNNQSITVQFVGANFHTSKKYQLAKTDLCFPKEPYIVHVLP